MDTNEEFWRGVQAEVLALAGGQVREGIRDRGFGELTAVQMVPVNIGVAAGYSAALEVLISRGLLVSPDELRRVMGVPMEQLRRDVGL